MAELLDQVASALRADQSVERTIASELAGPRATGRVMAVLPLCGMDSATCWAVTRSGSCSRPPRVGVPGRRCGVAACGVLWIEWLARQVGRPA